LPIKLRTSALAKRVNLLRKVLEPLTNIKGGPACRQSKGSNRREFIIGAYDGSQPAGGYTSWRFGTVAAKYQAMYYEIWLQDRTQIDLWSLERAYLHIYRIDPMKREDPETEYVLLHCDPNEPSSAAHGIYKQGPHLHVQAAPDPLRHAHVALNLGHLRDILTDAQSFTKAFKLSVTMLREEVLEPLRY
jgi:hypothetical protein